MPSLTDTARQAAEQQLSTILRESSGLELAQLDRSSTFLELGFDSLFLIQLSQRIKRRLGVKVAFRQLIEDIATVDGLVNYLTENGSFEPATSTPAASTPATSTPAAASASTSANPEPVSPVQAERELLRSEVVCAEAGDCQWDGSCDDAGGTANSAHASTPAAALPAVVPAVAPAPAPVVMPAVMPAAPRVVASQAIPSSNDRASSGTSLSVGAARSAPPSPATRPLSTAPTGPLGVPGSLLAEIVWQQNQLMLKHLELLQGASDLGGAPAEAWSSPAEALPAPVALAAPVTAPAPAPAPVPVPAPAPVTVPAPTPAIAAAIASVTAPASGSTSSRSVAGGTGVGGAESAAAASQAAAGDKKRATFERFGPYKPVRRGAGGGLTEQQQRHLDQFVARYTQRTASSRRHAQTHRPHFADPRGVAGYRRIWKSMVYQIVVERSQGSKLYDIDGNTYVDVAMGFGLNLFGQSPSFVTEAVQRQLLRGVEIGPQTPLTGEVAELLCQFSRKDRVTFCNTGSEAVMAALRLARTVTGKSKTVYFNKDYHGNFDQVLLRSPAAAGRAGSAPAAPGVPSCYSDNTIVLPYGTAETLEIIRREAHDIAAVLVEPVQSADPFTQPREFLQALRTLTRENQIALVMDEVITGFRAAPGGAQEWFGVWGDMATYGKVLGGGMPIGALAGTAEYMDALDGGNWRYEDDSEPEADMTFFAGTFVRHPLAIAAAYEVLKRVKEEGPGLQQRLTERTTYLAQTLNRFFEQEQFPIRVAQFTSLFRFMFPPDVEYADMLYFHLLDRGVFTRGWGDNCFLSTEHSDEDIEHVIRAVQESCREIRAGGFFPEPADPSRSGAGSVVVAERVGASGADEKKKTESLIRVVETMSPSQLRVDMPVAEVRTSGSAIERMSTINPIQEEGELPPLFCMPAADGLTLVYHELSACLGNNQPVYGLDSPAIYREAIPDTLEALAARFIEDMREIQPHGPYLVIGYCSGGTTALEVAQQLRQQGETVALLGLIETYNWRDAPSTHPTFWVNADYQRQRLLFHSYNFLLLPWREKRQFIGSKCVALGRRLGVWRAAVGGWFRTQKLQREGLVNMAEIWRKHDDLAEAYLPARYPGRLVHFRPKQDYRCHRSTEYEAEAVETHRLRVFPAGMMVRPFVAELATLLQREIAQGLAETATRD